MFLICKRKVPAGSVVAIARSRASGKCLQESTSKLCSAFMVAWPRLVANESANTMDATSATHVHLCVYEMAVNGSPDVNGLFATWFLVTRVRCQDSTSKRPGVRAISLRTVGSQLAPRPAAHLYCSTLPDNICIEEPLCVHQNTKLGGCKLRFISDGRDYPYIRRLLDYSQTLERPTTSTLKMWMQRNV